MTEHIQWPIGTRYVGQNENLNICTIFTLHVMTAKHLAHRKKEKIINEV